MQAYLSKILSENKKLKLEVLTLNLYQSYK